MSKEFKVGDKVKPANGAGAASVGDRVGTIVQINERSGVPFLVEFPGWEGGHDGNGMSAFGLKRRDRWWFARSDLTKVAPEKSPAEAAEIGDIVTISAWFSGCNPPGDYEVIEIDERTFNWDRRLKVKTSLGSDWVTDSKVAAIMCKAAELAKPETFIIVNEQRGAATYPHKHADIDAAEKEATRLAKLTPGDTFTIYKAVSQAKAEKPVIPPVEIVKLAA